MTAKHGTLLDIMRLWFGLDRRVTRRAYLLTGIGLMIVKYAVEVAAVQRFAGIAWMPLDALNPVFGVRVEMLRDAPDWFGLALAAWTLPFLWIGVTMSMRRAVDAGSSGWLGLLFFVPYLNYLFMLALAAVPTRKPPALDGLRPKSEEDSADESTDTLKGIEPPLRSGLQAVGAGVVIVLGMVAISASALAPHGLLLFVGSPFMIGTVGGFVHNRHERRTSGSTILVALATLLIAAGALVLFAVEGVICIAMALGLAFPLTIAGALFGRALTRHGHRRASEATIALAVLPLLSILEGLAKPSDVAFEARSAIEIAAPAEVVWKHVVSFSEIPPPTEWIFRTGVAFPVRARIDGTGVGAVRHCEFSTGAFVEPITHWERPRRLSFDVSEQPYPMHELSFYDELRPPHLEEAFRSRRGEFRLVSLPGGRTRLEGSTWYTLDLAPQWYWRVLADPLVHTIHGRVLEHIRALAEAEAARD